MNNCFFNETNDRNGGLLSTVFLCLLRFTTADCPPDSVSGYDAPSVSVAHFDFTAPSDFTALSASLLLLLLLIFLLLLLLLILADVTLRVHGDS